MNRVKRQQRYWQALVKGTPQQKKQLIKYATPDQVDAASEMSYNFLRGAIPLGRQKIRQLAPQKTILRRLGDPRRPLSERRRWFQKGGSAVQSIVQGLTRGLKRGAQKGFEKQKTKIVRGIKKSAQERLQRGVTQLMPQESTEDRAVPSDHRQTKIDQLQQQIQDMEGSLKKST